MKLILKPGPNEKAHSEPYQRSNLVRFVKEVNGCWALTIFKKPSILAGFWIRLFNIEKNDRLSDTVFSHENK